MLRDQTTPFAWLATGIAAQRSPTTADPWDADAWDGVGGWVDEPHRRHWEEALTSAGYRPTRTVSEVVAFMEQVELLVDDEATTDDERRVRLAADPPLLWHVLPLTAAQRCDLEADIAAPYQAAEALPVLDAILELDGARVEDPARPDVLHVGLRELALRLDEPDDVARSMLASLFAVYPAFAGEDPEDPAIDSLEVVMDWERFDREWIVMDVSLDLGEE